MGRVLRLLIGLSVLPAAARAQEPLQGATAQVNGIQMHYEVSGNGPPLVLLHGFSGCGQTWSAHAAVLAKDYRVIVPDLRGHGRSTNPAGVFTHALSAQDIFALLDHLGIQQFKAMGISTGGMTLLHMATRQPSRVEAMVLIGATAYFPEAARKIQAESSPDSIPANEMERYRRCHTQGDEQIKALVRQFRDFKDNYDDMNFTEPYLGTITARTLIVHGDRDEFFPVAIPTMMYRSIPKSYLWIVPNGGHVPIMGNRAAAFREVVTPFLSGAWVRR